MSWHLPLLGIILGCCRFCSWVQSPGPLRQSAGAAFSCLRRGEHAGVQPARCNPGPCRGGRLPCEERAPAAATAAGPPALHRLLPCVLIPRLLCRTSSKEAEDAGVKYDGEGNPVQQPSQPAPQTAAAAAGQPATAEQQQEQGDGPPPGDAEQAGEGEAAAPAPASSNALLPPQQQQEHEDAGAAAAAVRRQEQPAGSEAGGAAGREDDEDDAAAMLAAVAEAAAEEPTSRPSSGAAAGPHHPYHAMQVWWGGGWCWEACVCACVAWMGARLLQCPTPACWRLGGAGLQLPVTPLRLALVPPKGAASHSALARPHRALLPCALSPSVVVHSCRGVHSHPTIPPPPRAQPRVVLNHAARPRLLSPPPQYPYHPMYPPPYGFYPPPHYLYAGQPPPGVGPGLPPLPRGRGGRGPGGYDDAAAAAAGEAPPPGIELVVLGSNRPFTGAGPAAAAAAALHTEGQEQVNILNLPLPEVDPQVGQGWPRLRRCPCEQPLSWAVLAPRLVACAADTSPHWHAKGCPCGRCCCVAAWPSCLAWH